MKNSRKLSGLFLVVAGLFLFNSCNKDEVESGDVIAKTTVTDYISMINSFSLSSIEDLSTGDEDGLKSATVSDCLTVTIHENEDGEFWPRSWTLDFGTEACESFNGIVRKGMIHVNLSDHWRNEASLRTISYDNFYVDNVNLEGEKSIENTGLNESENMTWLRKMTDGKLTYEDGTITTWNCERYSELVEGGDTWLFRDDIYMVTGGGNGVKDGLAFTTEITIPLEYVFGCRFPLTGELTINVEGSETVIINYGEGECDNIATQTIGEEVTEIELGRS